MRFSVRYMLAYAAALMALVSCGPVGSRGTVLRVTNWGGAGGDSEYDKTVRELYAQFERENPDIRIQVEGIPGSQDYVSKVLLSHVAHAAPDIITLDASSAAVFIENDVLRDLKPLAEGDPEFTFDDFYPNVVAIASRGEKVYAIPNDFTPMVMYYNEELFDAAGVPYPKPGWTRAEFLDAARKLTKNGKYGFKFVNWMPGWVMWLWNAGGDVIAKDSTGAYRASGVFDSEENVKTIEWLRDVVAKEKVAPSLSQAAAGGVDMFANAECAMEISGHWALTGYKDAPKLKLDRIGVVPLPNETGKPVTVMYEAGFAIGKYCKNPEAAWKFIKFMTRFDMQDKYNRTGIAVSGRKDVSALRSANDEREKTFERIVPTARGPWGAQVTGYDLVEEIGQKMMDAVMRQGVDLKTALKQAAADMDKELAKR